MSASDYAHCAYDCLEDSTKTYYLGDTDYKPDILTFHEECYKTMLDKEYARGIADGLEMYAWMKDGTTYVGTTGTTLKEALSKVKK